MITHDDHSSLGNALFHNKDPKLPAARRTSIRRRAGKSSWLACVSALSIAFGLLQPGTGVGAEPYSIVNHYTGMVVDVWEGRVENTHTVLWPDWGGANQRFDLIPVDPNNPRSDFQIRARHAGKCLDVSGAVFDDGAIVETFDCHGGPSQLWFAEMVTDPYVQCQPNMFCDNARMIVRARHSGKCLDAANGGPSLENRPKQGAFIQQWTCFNNLNQFWDFNGGPPIVR